MPVRAFADVLARADPGVVSLMLPVEIFGVVLASDVPDVASVKLPVVATEGTINAVLADSDPDSVP